MHIEIITVLKFKNMTSSAVIGHSLREIAAAVVADALTAQEGAVIVCTKAHLRRSMADLNAMLLVNIILEKIVEEFWGKDNIFVALVRLLFLVSCLAH